MNSLRPGKRARRGLAQANFIGMTKAYPGFVIPGISPRRAPPGAAAGRICRDDEANPEFLIAGTLLTVAAATGTVPAGMAQPRARGGAA